MINDTEDKLNQAKSEVDRWSKVLVLENRRLSKEADNYRQVALDMTKALRELVFKSYECYTYTGDGCKDPSNYDEYDEFMAPVWKRAKALVGHQDE